MLWEYETTEAVMKVLLRKVSITREEANEIDNFLRKESDKVPAEVSILFKKFHSVINTISGIIESEEKPARKEDGTVEWEVKDRNYSVDEMCSVRELAKEVLETIESSKTFDEKFGIWNFEQDKKQLLVMQVLRRAL